MSNKEVPFRRMSPKYDITRHRPGNLLTFTCFWHVLSPRFPQWHRLFSTIHEKSFLTFQIFQHLLNFLLKTV